MSDNYDLHKLESISIIIRNDKDRLLQRDVVDWDGLIYIIQERYNLNEEELNIVINMCK